jgi:hypothetical protein
MPNKAITHSPQYWWDRAEKMRRMADLIAEPAAKQKMLAVVESYEKLARRAEDEAKAPG